MLTLYYVKIATNAVYLTCKMLVLCSKNAKNVVRYRRGGASRSELKSIDCQEQSHHNSIGNLPPAT